MRHQPHLYIPAPWTDRFLEVSAATARHLTTVLRLPTGSELTYTDGTGGRGAGVWTGVAVDRGEEWPVERPLPRVKLAVAPPRSKDRQRFVVEKLQELVVDALLWIRTERTQVPAPKAERTRSWAITALEQSRGAHLMPVGSATIEDLGGFAAADPTGASSLGDLAGAGAVEVAIGPEGGFTDHELELFERRVALTSTILRTETAAITVAAANRM